ncbi:hypothetical protein [Streptomyces sp. NPDC000618]|uniref:hypothetical protein n=1 Tax=Streptomyces sp. NPDC000618 TaxID=3154265 RepID=UPI0033168506
MRMRGDRLRALAGAALAVGVAVACGGPAGGGGTAAPTATGVTSSTPAATPRFDEEIELSDGRRVGMAYVAGRGLVERHRDADSTAWSAPNVVYATATDRCQSLTLKEFDGTVAVIADWGVYCYDGEPPTESIAAVGTTDLARWDTNLTRSFDGWTKVTAEGGGDSRRLLFTRGSTESLTRLGWTRSGGFAEVEEIPR